LNPTKQHRGREPRRLFEVFRAFLRLGLISFGGPVAHLGYLREECVSRRRWLDDAAYGDLVALCQFLPGPASSQVVFALGTRRAGWLGGLLASLCFTLPSAVLMIAFAYGVAALGGLQHAGWLHGLKLAAVAVVAQAVWGMGRNLCPDRTRLTIAVGAAALLLFFPGALVQVGVILGGGLIGWRLYRKTLPHAEQPGPSDWRHHLIAVVGVLLAALYNPVWTEGVKDARDAAAAVLAFGLLQWWKAPPWLVVIAAAATGQWLLT